jgi:uncharacterized protein YeaO (DUF488 family)
MLRLAPLSARYLHYWRGWEKKPGAHGAHAGMARQFRLKRIYAPAEAADGLRVLVDRLWPRGISKDKARIDQWLKDIAPSDALRRRVHADPSAWDAFVLDYAHELAREPAHSATEELRKHLRKGPVTLLYAARDEEHNNAVALKRLLERRR